MKCEQDTIAAIATAQGTGGIAIVRISGPGAGTILKSVFVPAVRREHFESHRLMYGWVKDACAETVDEVMAVWMQAPRTYTREDVAEIHCHGGGVSAVAVLERVLEAGARVAEPGEFTKRAFLNGRIDLAGAEAVMQLINANSQAAARASIRQLQGGVSGFVRGVSDRLRDMLALLEASVDFPEEVDEEATVDTLVSGLQEQIEAIRAHSDDKSARLLREGASIVLAGKPNVGKSSLMNALLHQQRAIVTDIPGTTRDVLTERISIGGILAQISDTAGQRVTTDPIERLGVDRARQAAERADVVLIVLDAAQPLDPSDEALVAEADERAVICLNKQDLEAVISAKQLRSMTEAPVLEVSATSGEGLNALMEELTRRLSANDADGGRMTVSRHIEAARAAAACLERAIEAATCGLPLDTAAIDLREALNLLAEITGENATEAVIDRVFESFCVGK